jgi:hypothetical protein
LVAGGTEWFIALIMCSTCFGHFYAHHQDLEAKLVLLPHMVCNALVAGGLQSGSGQQFCVRDEGSCLTAVEQLPSSRTQNCCPAPDRRPPATKALHAICGNNTSL